MNIFKDKATLILRTLLAHPGQRWHSRLLAKSSHTSLGLVSRTIQTLARLGFVETGGRGRGGYILFNDPAGLLNLWTEHYDFSQNTISSFYLPDIKTLPTVYATLQRHQVRYALTLHSGANLLTHYFMTDQCHLYIDSDDIEKMVIALASHIPIQRLASGGNLHLITPYYKCSVFDHMRMIRRRPVVSNLQLYLDLFHFYPRGYDHAVYLREMLKDKLYE